VAAAKTKHPNPARTGPGSHRRVPIVPLAIGAVALLAIVAVLATSGGDGGDGTASQLEQTRPVTVTGQALALHAEGVDPAVGAAAPELAGARFDGTELRIGDDGRPKVLVFLAHWCPHCQREVPVLVDWLAENGTPDDLDIYGVATATSADRPNYPPSAWLEREGFTPLTLADDEAGSAAQAYGLAAFPFFVAVDAENQVVARGSGELTVEQLEALFDQARTG
jgi:cytochrome c biogenesis protein CcmG/thiol:disulfide interchange protein DsbE